MTYQFWTERSLWDVEDLTDMPKVRDMTIGPVSPAEVAEFARRYHYTHNGNNLSWRWGLWTGPVLLGVVAYNLPPMSVCEVVFGKDHWSHVWHMSRLICAEHSPRNSESFLIAGSMKKIEEQFPDVWGIITYAATHAGHIGTVYQATNAMYVGTGGSPFYFTDQDGEQHGDYYGGRKVTRDEAESRGWTVEVGQPKHRYVYILGTPAQRRYRRRLMRMPVLPYPKRGPGAAASS